MKTGLPEEPLPKPGKRLFVMTEEDKRAAIVLANGRLSDPAALRARLSSRGNALVIAADGGSQHAETLGLKPDIVIGDFDSLAPALRAELEAEGTRFEQAPTHKDETDLELALLYAAQRGVEQVAILGALGGRLDMTLANVLLLAHPGLQSLQIELWAGWQTACLISPPGAEISGHPGDTLSLIPLGGDAEGIITHNLEYPLNGETLFFGPARGVSNVLTASTARVELRAGLLLAIHTPGRA